MNDCEWFLNNHVIPLKETMVSLTSLSNGGAIACACDKSNPDFSSEALVDASMPSLSSLNIQFVTKDSSSSKNSEFVTFKQKREDLVKKNEKISFSYSKPIVEKKIACVRSQPVLIVFHIVISRSLCLKMIRWLRLFLLKREKVMKYLLLPSSLIPWFLFAFL